MSCFSDKTDDRLFELAQKIIAVFQYTTQFDVHLSEKHGQSAPSSESLQDTLFKELNCIWSEAQNRGDRVQGDIEHEVEYNSDTLRITCFGELLQENEIPTVLPFLPNRRALK